MRNRRDEVEERREGSKERNSARGQLPLEGRVGNRGWKRASSHNMIRDSRRRESPSSRSYPRGCVRLAGPSCGSSPCSLLEASFSTCSPRFVSCLLGADLISISRCSSPRGFARVVVSRCSFSYERKRNDGEIAAPFVSRTAD